LLEHFTEATRRLVLATRRHIGARVAATADRHELLMSGTWDELLPRVLRVPDPDVEHANVAGRARGLEI